MINVLDQVYYRATRQESELLNAAYLPFNGLFECVLADIGCLFNSYFQRGTELYPWKCNDWPSNIGVCDDFSQLSEVVIDFVVANNRSRQTGTAATIASSLHCPLVIIDHELPMGDSSPEMRKYVNSMMPEEAILVSPHQVVNDEWHYDDSMTVRNIPYGFKLFEEMSDETSGFLIVDKRPTNLLVVGDYVDQDQHIVEEMMNIVPSTVGLGYNRKTKPYESFQEIKEAMQQAKFCLVATEPSKPPLLPLLAAAQGCVVITNKTAWTEGVFSEGEVAFFDYDHIRRDVKAVIKDGEDLKFGSRELILNEFGPGKARRQWKLLLEEIRNRTYIR